MKISVTYCPEDDKLRIYSGYVAREVYDELRKAGFVATPKQGCDFAAVWTIKREDLALSLLEDGDDIEDEDQSPEERAADRAERFGEYRDKRRVEAGGLADRYDGGGQVHGYQSQERADRAARRADRVRCGSLSQWSKAEYWQRRTAGVIGHALYKSSAHVRRGRILEIEAEIRRTESKYTPHADSPEVMQHDRNAMYDYQTGEYDRPPEPHVLVGPKGRGCYYERKAALLAIEKAYQRYLAHLRLRLEYERQMLAAEGGTAGDAEMEPGGFIRAGTRTGSVFSHVPGGWMQIHAINKSPKTGRVTSVKVWGKLGCNADKGEGLVSINVERLPEGSYRPPTNEEQTEFEEREKKRKATEKARKPKAPTLINPTDKDAERLQAIWNAEAKANHDARPNAQYLRNFEPATVTRMTQKQYSALSKGEYARCETRTLHAGAKLSRRPSNMWTSEGAAYDKALSPPVCKIRVTGYNPNSVIVLIDKPQKPLPWDALAEVEEAEAVYA